MLTWMFRTPRRLLIMFCMFVNLLSGIVGILVSAPLLWNHTVGSAVALPLIPWAATLIVAVPLSAFASRPMGKPLNDIIRGIQEISKGNYSVRVDEVGDGELKELLHSFNQMTAELNSTEMMRDDFINTFSHEFKTPIVSIRGFAKRIRQGGLKPDQEQEYLDYIVRESERLANLSSNILLLSRYEYQQLEGKREAYALDEQIRRCILLLEKRWSAKQIQFDLQMETITYVGNEEMLDQVWLNLIGNAIKFSPQSSVIHISAVRKGQQLSVAVADEGIGMNRQTMEHIFDKFYQGDLAHKSEGNGLGLALVRRILDLCGGDITVESEEGRGSTFRVSLHTEEDTMVKQASSV